MVPHTDATEAADSLLEIQAAWSVLFPQIKLGEELHSARTACHLLSPCGVGWHLPWAGELAAWLDLVSQMGVL